MKRLKKEMAKFCRENIEDYDLKAQLAWGYMDRFRCPLRIASSLYDEIYDLMEEFCEEHDLNIDDYEPEDIFYEMED